MATTMMRLPVALAMAATLSSVLGSGLVDHPIACDAVTYLDGEWEVSE